jgi:hypothetical protein
MLWVLAVPASLGAGPAGPDRARVDSMQCRLMSAGTARYIRVPDPSESRDKDCIVVQPRGMCEHARHQWCKVPSLPSRSGPYKRSRSTAARAAHAFRAHCACGTNAGVLVRPSWGGCQPRSWAGGNFSIAPPTPGKPCIAGMASCVSTAACACSCKPPANKRARHHRRGPLSRRLRTRGMGAHEAKATSFIGTIVSVAITAGDSRSERRGCLCGRRGRRLGCC